MTGLGLSPAAQRANDAVVAALDSALERGSDRFQLASELFVVVGALDSDAQLRRVLTEPQVPIEARAGLLQSLLGERVAGGTKGVLMAAIGQRWHSPRPMADALEVAGVFAVVSGDQHEADQVQDELFRFARILDDNSSLREALVDPVAPMSGRRALLDGLLGEQVQRPTKLLLDQVLANRHDTLASSLTYLQSLAARRFDERVATAWVASPLEDEHRDRLVRALSTQYDSGIHLNVVVQPDVLGGVRVVVGDDMIDATVRTRLEQAQRALTS